MMRKCQDIYKNELGFRKYIRFLKDHETLVVQHQNNFLQQKVFLLEGVRVARVLPWLQRWSFFSSFTIMQDNTNI